MDHLAIMRKSWRLTQKILSGKKKIESRWYKSQRAPWNKIHEGERVYFKDSGEPVTIKAEVAKVLQFSDLSPQKVKEILAQYGGGDGLGIDQLDVVYEKFKDKRYCILVFLNNPQKIAPFEIDKRGYGNMAAWISVESIEQLKKNS